MARRLAWAMAMLSLTANCPGQDLPRPSEGGIARMAELIESCVEAGGLARPEPGQSKAKLPPVSDPAAVRDAVARFRDRLTPELCDALIGVRDHVSAEESPSHLVLLEAVGRAAGDDRVLAFAALFAGDVEWQAGRFDRSERSFREARRLFARAGDPAWEARSRHQQAILYNTAGLYDKAVEGFREALTLFESKFGEAHPMVPSCLQGLGSTLHSLGDNAGAIRALERAASLLSRKGGPPDVPMSNVLTSLALAYHSVGQTRKAISPLRRALEIRRDSLPPDDVEIGKAYDNLGDLYEELGEPALALEHYAKARTIFEMKLPEDHPDRAINLGSTAKALAALDRLGEALSLFDRAIAAMRRDHGANHPAVAGYLSDQASVLFQTGDYGRALEILTEVLALRKSRFGPVHRSVAVSLSKLGYANARLGRLPEALAKYEEALAMFRGLYGPKHPEVAANLNNVASIRSKLGDNAGAVGAMEEALSIYREALGDSHPNVATVLSNLGMREQELGRLDSAEEHLGQALAIDRVLFGRVHSQVALGHFNLAGLREARGDRPGTIRSIDEAISALAPAADAPARPFSELDADSIRPIPLAYKVLIGRGRQLEKGLVGAPDAATLRESARSFELAASVLERIRRDQVKSPVSKGVIDEEAFEAFPERISALRRLHELDGRPQGPAVAFACAEQGIARLFLETLGTSRSRDLAGVERPIRDEEDALTAKVARLDRAIAEEQDKPLDSRNPTEVARLLDLQKALAVDRARLLERIAREYPQYAALNYPSPCSIEEARACLDADEVALIYVQGGRESSLIVLPGPDGGDPTIHRLPGSEKIAELVAAMAREKLLEDPEATRDLGVEAYRILLAPAAASIRGKHLVVVAGGVFGRLPFALLAEPGEGRPGEVNAPQSLILRHRIRQAPSMSALHQIGLWLRARRPPPKGLWALGDPIYSPDDPRLAGVAEATLTRPARQAETGSATPPRLTASGQEVAGLKLIMGAGDEDVRTGTMASESAVKRLSAEGSLRDYRYVHFACHGTLGREGGEPPSLVLWLVGNRDGDDGQLTLDEVTGLNLNSDLVVLSACETGQGRLSAAEGITGLARAFIHAGAGGVVASLWRVDDAATSDLMVGLYGGLKAGQSSADALRSAQLKMIEAGAPPLHWAPFVLIGR